MLSVPWAHYSGLKVNEQKLSPPPLFSIKTISIMTNKSICKVYLKKKKITFMPYTSPPFYFPIVHASVKASLMKLNLLG